MKFLMIIRLAVLAVNTLIFGTTMRYLYALYHEKIQTGEITEVFQYIQVPFVILSLTGLVILKIFESLIKEDIADHQEG